MKQQRKVTSSKLFVGVFFICALLVLIHPSPVSATFFQDDSGIQTFYQNGVPQFTKIGKIQFSYTNDSFFPLGMYTVDLGPVPDGAGRPQFQPWVKYNLDSTKSRNTLPELASAGFNTIIRLINGKPPYDFTPNEAELNLVDRSGIKAFVSLSAPAIYAANSSTEPNDYNIHNINDLKALVNRLKTHPSVIGYSLFDELKDPLSNSLPMDDAKWTTIHNTIKNIDPNRSIYANNTARIGTHPPQYCFPGSFSDFTSFDAYPKQEAPGVTLIRTKLYWLGSQITAAARTCGNKPVLAVVQAYSRLSGAPTDNVLYLPTAAELRAQYYTVIANGATAIALYHQNSWYHWGTSATAWNQPLRGEPGWKGISPQVTPDLWAMASQLNHDIETWKWVLLSKTATDAYHVYIDKPVQTERLNLISLLKNPGDGNRYLLAVEEGLDATPMGSDPHQVKFSFPGSPTITKVTSIFENNRNIPVSNNEFTSTYKKGDVFFYKIEYGTLPPPIPSDLTDYGDVPGDEVNIYDYNILVGDFGKTGSPRWIKADITGQTGQPDGKVDIFDYNVLVGNFGK